MYFPVVICYLFTSFVNGAPSTLPAQFDWRTHIRLSPIQSEADCFSFYAFATAETVEAAYSIHRKTDLILSKQQLVDCTFYNSGNSNYTNQGCSGGGVGSAYEYFANHGVVEEVNYPYIGKDQQCFADNYNLTAPAYFIMRYEHSKNLTDLDMMMLIWARGPISVYIYSENSEFKNYKSGIIRDLYPNTEQFDHTVVLVGWSVENGVEHWILRNSWGTAWGEKGYARLERSHNLIGVNNYVSYPILD